MANIDVSPHDHARPSRDALETDQELGLGGNTPDQRMQQLADEMARKSSDRTRKFEEGSGVVPQTDGH